jgi:kinesin family protein C2/C3
LQVYDLLSNGGGQSVGGVSLDIRQGADNSVSVPGLQQMPVHSLQDVMSVFSRGTANRATASTNLNEHSSRSHLIVQVDVTTQRGSDMPVRGRLNLVDLAGSERVGKVSLLPALKERQLSRIVVRLFLTGFLWRVPSVTGVESE